MSQARVWIDSEPLQFCEVEAKNNFQGFLLCPVKMRFNWEGLNQFKGQASPFHEKFCSSATKYYESLGACRPELLRLRELLKLCAVSALLQQLCARFPSLARELSKCGYCKLNNSIPSRSLVPTQGSKCTWIPRTVLSDPSVQFERTEDRLTAKTSTSIVYGGVELQARNLNFVPELNFVRAWQNHLYPSLPSTTSSLSSMLKK